MSYIFVAGDDEPTITSDFFLLLKDKSSNEHRDDEKFVAQIFAHTIG